MKEKKKPVCKMIGTDGNIFFLAARVNKTLKKAGLDDESREFSSKLWKCQSYDNAIDLMSDYVEIT
jgi:hypothetical protein